MRNLIILLALIPTMGLAAEPGSSLPVFFFPNSTGFALETPTLRARFRGSSVVLQIDHRNLGFHFLGAEAGVTIEGTEPMPGKVNFFIGTHIENWKQDIPIYRKILYRALYPGIDMTYAAFGARIKSEFTVGTGADPDQIKIEYPEAESVSVSGSGELIVKSAGAVYREQAPEIYQESGDQRVSIEGHYYLLNAHTVGFEIGIYDHAKSLVIDPVISYATYLGGGSTGAVTGLAVDPSGNLYVAGWTQAHDFPIVGAAQASNQGGVDAYIAKLNPSGTALIYATYVGGQGYDAAAGIALDSSRNAYVTGSTSSTNFPLASPIRSRLGGSRTAFALKLNAAGNALLYSTYLGGTNYDMGNSIAVDGSGNAYIAGDTYSTDFPVSHAVQSVLSGGCDAFITKLTSAGAISFSTFLGGGGNDHAAGIALDSSANVYVAGGTFSTNFPIFGAIQATNAGGQDAFLTKISSSGSTLLYSTYLGGTGGNPTAPEQATAIAVDSAGNAYVTGVTSSSNFPISSGVLQSSFKGVQDAFITKINAAGNSRVYSTYLGGSSADWSSGIAVDSSGNVYIAGFTWSADFPTAGGVQATSHGTVDAFVSEVNAAATALVFSTYYGGSGADAANAIAIDASGNVYAGGQTNSFDLALQGPLQSSNNGGSSGWVMRVGSVIVAPAPPQVVSVSPSTGSGATQVFTFVYSDAAGASDLGSVQVLFNSTLSFSGGCYVNVNVGANAAQLASDSNTGFMGTVVLGSSATSQNSQCTLNGSGSQLVVSGNTLTLKLSLTFQPAFAGAKNSYGDAQTAGGLNSGWQSLGVWTVPAGLPQAVSVAPSSGSGLNQSFTLVYSDPAGASDLGTVLVLFNTSITAGSACYVNVDPIHGLLALVNDGGTGAFGPITLGTVATLQNSQCKISTTGSSVNSSGNVLTVILAVTFSSAFAGTKNIYSFAQTVGSLTSGWQTVGTWGVFASVPQAVSVVPASGSGLNQSFTLVYADSAGASDLGTVLVLFNTSISAGSACYVNVDPIHGSLSLVNDGGTGAIGPITPGTGAIVQNSQCKISATGSSLNSSGNVLTVILAVTFSPTFTGTKNTYGFAQTVGGLTSGWQTLGSWTVSRGVPQAVSVAPSSGAGAIQSFTLLYSDSAGATDLGTVLVLFNTSVTAAGACYVNVDPILGSLSLVNDGGTGAFGPITLGSAATVQNSQCKISATGSSVSASGNNLTVILAVTFSSVFSGTKTTYGFAQTTGGLTSGFQALGTFSIP